ncbi:hypothetical protein ELY14_01255 [Legionella septentrionalis]|nr:hypothetical protein ELY14_01255 [Legionella septentrionalis]
MLRITYCICLFSRERKMHRKASSLLYGILLFPLFFAAPLFALPLYKTPQCVLLGGEPSLIIKFKHYTSNLKTKKPLPQTILQKISLPGIKFVNAKTLSRGLYLVFFELDKKQDIANPPVQLKILRKNCFTRESVQQFVNYLKKHPEVESVIPNFIIPHAATGLTGKSPFQQQILQIEAKQWNLMNPPGGVNIEEAWGITTGNPNAMIAVNDSGVVNNNSLNPNLVVGVHFFDGGETSVGAEQTCGPECSGELFSHGTAVAGVAAASGRLAYGERVYGVGPSLRILPVNQTTPIDDTARCNAAGLTAPCLLTVAADIINALAWVAGEPFTDLPTPPVQLVALNASYGIPNECEPLLQELIDQILAKNITVAAAAGNEDLNTETSFPANCRGVIATAATDVNGLRTYYSNFGNLVALAAPGGDPTVPGPNDGLIYTTGLNEYISIAGTSFASPHVAGVVALLYSIDPTLTPKRVRKLLTSTVSPFPPSSNPEKSCVGVKSCGAGILNTGNALQQAQSIAPALQWNANLTINLLSSNFATISWLPARWLPKRSTPIVYSVYLNGIPVPGCTDLLTFTCTLSNLAANTNYTVEVFASDYRKILSVSSGQKPLLAAPVLTQAVRNPLNKTVAFIYFSNFGTVQSGISYTVNGLPGASASFDAMHNRFVVSGVNTPRAVTISITSHFGIMQQSNSVTIPAIL